MDFSYLNSAFTVQFFKLFQINPRQVKTVIPVSFRKLLLVRCFIRCVVRFYFRFMHQSIETPHPPPPGPTWGSDIDCCQKLSNVPPPVAKFSIQMDENASTIPPPPPQGLGTQMKKMENYKDSSKTDTNF